MDLQDYEDASFSEPHYEEITPHRKNVRKILEERLEHKRLREEFKDEFDEITGEFDWD